MVTQQDKCVCSGQWEGGWGGKGLGIQGPIARAIEGNRVGPEIALCNRALIVWGPQQTAGTADIHRLDLNADKAKS